MFLIKRIFLSKIILLLFIISIECKNLKDNKSLARIIGGDNVSDNSANFLVGIYIDGAQWCGGSIISSSYTLTAGHCLYQKNNVTLYFGYKSLSSPSSNAVSMDIYHSDFIIHPDFDSISLQNDIGVIKHTNQLEFSDIIQPIPIFSSSDASSYTLESGTATLYGWGVVSDSSTTINDYLQYVIVNLISYDSCHKYYSTLTNSNLCTISSTDDLKGGCSGDSGGPLVVDIDDISKIIGLLSFTSKNGCDSTDPRGYTKVPSYIDWLCEETDISNCGE